MRERQHRQEHHTQQLDRIAAHEIEAGERGERQDQESNAGLDEAAIHADQKEPDDHRPVRR